MRETFWERAQLYVGKQETFGSNDGPNIRRWKAMLGSGVVAARGIPWCAIFGTAMLMERNGLNRRGLLDALHFRPGSTYFESCDSWVAEVEFLSKQPKQSGVEYPCFVDLDDVRPGDIVLLMKRNLDGSWSKTDAHHYAICRQKPLDLSIPTVEGNTVPGTGSDRASREGDGVYDRFRVRSLDAAYRIIRLPVELTGYVAPLSSPVASPSASPSKEA